MKKLAKVTNLLILLLVFIVTGCSKDKITEDNSNIVKDQINLSVEFESEVASDMFLMNSKLLRGGDIKIWQTYKGHINVYAETEKQKHIFTIGVTPDTFLHNISKLNIKTLEYLDNVILMETQTATYIFYVNNVHSLKNKDVIVSKLKNDNLLSYEAHSLSHHYVLNNEHRNSFNFKDLKTHDDVVSYFEKITSEIGHKSSGCQAGGSNSTGCSVGDNSSGEGCSANCSAGSYSCCNAASSAGGEVVASSCTCENQ